MDVRLVKGKEERIAKEKKEKGLAEDDALENRPICGGY